MHEKAKGPQKPGPKDSFLHVIHDHRYLAAAGRNWNLLKANHESSGAQKKVDELLPNVDEAVLDSVLLHARSLIEFYILPPSGTDIRLCDFEGLRIEPGLRKNLENYKRPIDVHAMHMTAWRHVEYRDLHATGRDANAVNFDWNERIPHLVDLILVALKSISEKACAWKYPFSALYDACSKRYLDERFPWPRQLAEKDHVREFVDKTVRMSAEKSEP